MAIAMGLDASPMDRRDGPDRTGSKRWAALFVVLAAGWGILFGYSAMFLTEDVPFRSGDPVVLAEPPAFGFPPMPHASAAPASVPAAPARHAAAEAVPAAVPVSVAAPAPAPRTDRAEYVGTWGPTEAACGRRSRRRG